MPSVPWLSCFIFCKSRSIRAIKRFVLPFAALQDNGAVAVPVGECGGGEDGIIGQVVAPGLPVGPPDAAVEAVFDAEVGNFYQPAHVDAVADGPVAQFAAAGV